MPMGSRWFDFAPKLCTAPSVALDSAARQPPRYSSICRFRTYLAGQQTRELRQLRSPPVDRERGGALAAAPFR